MNSINRKPPKGIKK